MISAGRCGGGCSPLWGLALHYPRDFSSQANDNGERRDGWVNRLRDQTEDSWCLSRQWKVTKCWWGACGLDLLVSKVWQAPWTHQLQVAMPSPLIVCPIIPQRSHKPGSDNDALLFSANNCPMIYLSVLSPQRRSQLPFSSSRVTTIVTAVPFIMIQTTEQARGNVTISIYVNFQFYFLIYLSLVLLHIQISLLKLCGFFSAK